jgi:hypothetical protein
VPTTTEYAPTSRAFFASVGVDIPPSQITGTDNLLTNSYRKEKLGGCRCLVASV